MVIKSMIYMIRLRGQAIINYSSFSDIGFQIKGIFDVNPKLIGVQFKGMEVLDVEELEEYVTKNDVDIAILCVPESQVVGVYNLIKDNVNGVWNFATIDLESTEKTNVENVNLNDSLFNLVYFINHK